MVPSVTLECNSVTISLHLTLSQLELFSTCWPLFIVEVPMFNAMVSNVQVIQCSDNSAIEHFDPMNYKKSTLQWRYVFEFMFVFKIINVIEFQQVQTKQNF